MHAAADRPEFAPPPPPGLLRAFALAVLAHLLLVAALMHGLRWQRDAQQAAVEAELWSAVPQQAAPKEVPPPPAPPAPPAPPPPQPRPVEKAQPKPEPPAKSDADIALEREKRKRLEEQRRQAELEKQRAERAKAEAKKREEELARRKREEELAKKKLEQQKQLAEAKRKEEEKRKRLQQEQEARVARLREENLKRIQGMAGGTGAPTSAGTAARSAGPSESWAGRVQARVRPNIVFTEAVSGNPKAEVEVRAAPDGTIVGKRLVRSSGVKAWDDAVLRALDKTEALPRDVDGRVPSPVVIEFRPRG